MGGEVQKKRMQESGIKPVSCMFNRMSEEQGSKAELSVNHVCIKNLSEKSLRNDLISGSCGGEKAQCVVNSIQSLLRELVCRISGVALS